MRKVAVITMHRVYNYGSVLQTYATQKLFEDKELECEIIDYISPFRAKKPLFLEYPPQLDGKRIKKLVYYIMKVPSFVLKDITFGNFIKKYLNISSKQYITNKDLLDDPPQADIYITGSDQVWNSKYNHGIDGSYYLNFVDDSVKKIAFVSSFGRDKLSEKEKIEVTPLLKRFDFISVRENNAVNILSDMGIKSICLIDPTLQINKNDWEKIASKRKIKEKYLLLFLLYNEDNGATEYAVKVAKHKHLKLAKLSWELKCPTGVNILFSHRNPQDFLSLFIHADYVVTNSFHGVAFSINFNRQFTFIPRSEFNGRIESLLKITGLTRRIINFSNDYDPSNYQIEYDGVNQILDSERNKAKDFIDKALADNGGKEQCNH